MDHKSILLVNLIPTFTIMSVKGLDTLPVWVKSQNLDLKSYLIYQDSWSRSTFDIKLHKNEFNWYLQSRSRLWRLDIKALPARYFLWPKTSLGNVRWGERTLPGSCFGTEKKTPQLTTAIKVMKDPSHLEGHSAVKQRFHKQDLHGRVIINVWCMQHCI